MECNYKDSIWALELIKLQREDGSWGYFHSLSESEKYPFTTEQALRRLCILGYDSRDEVIQKAVAYMRSCLSGETALPDRREKTHNWDLFITMMLSAWILRFTQEDDIAVRTAAMWAEVVTKAFSSGEYSHDRYTAAFQEVFQERPFGGRIVDFVSFYQVSLLAGRLDVKIERLVMDYILNHEAGIYYICGGPLGRVPAVFASKEASRYIGAMELLAGFHNSLDKLDFVLEWLKGQQEPDGGWDMGSKAKDRIYFPLSDNWRTPGNRKCDCTFRIQKLLNRLQGLQAGCEGGER